MHLLVGAHALVAVIVLSSTQDFTIAHALLIIRCQGLVFVLSFVLVLYLFASWNSTNVITFARIIQFIENGLVILM